MVLVGVLTNSAILLKSESEKYETSTLLQILWNIFISNSVLDSSNGINCQENAFFQILAARYRSNPTKGTERSRNEGRRGGNHKKQQHAIYRGKNGGEADTKYKVGGHVCSAAGGNYHGSVNVISQARYKPHQFRMDSLNSARFPPRMLFNCKQYCSIPNDVVRFQTITFNSTESGR